jgi:L,D-peptidoglycan transpeptidase YkuD (ErfK/YbiS/YcfS/YnhG family)
MDLLFTAQPGQPHASATWQGQTFPALVGKNGIVPASDKKEGDAASPAGTWAMLYGFYRADRVAKPVGGTLPWRAMTPEDGWCDESTDPLYNQSVPATYPAGHEDMWRQDTAYDYVIVLSYNTTPPVPGKGSAIFLHVWRPGGTHTAGCAALRPEDMQTLAPRFNIGDTVTFQLA